MAAALPAQVTEVPGLERLMQLASVNVHQTSSGCNGNNYTVFSGDEVMFIMTEDVPDTFYRSRAKKAFTFDGVENTGRTVFHLRRPNVSTSDKMELHMNNALVCVVRKETTFMTPVFSVNDAHDHPTLRIKGEITDNDFEIQTINKQKIGGIKKKFGGLLKEMFSYNDDYVVTFPADLDVGFKLAVIGACVLIVFRFCRPRGWSISENVELYLNEQLASVIRMERTWLTPLFTINDPKEQPVLRLKGKISEITIFQLQTKAKAPIGSIHKLWRGWKQEMFSHNTDFIINFPADLALQYKLGVIVACVFIDFTFFEGK